MHRAGPAAAGRRVHDRHTARAGPQSAHRVRAGGLPAGAPQRPGVPRADRVAWLDKAAAVCAAARQPAGDSERVANVAGEWFRFGHAGMLFLVLTIVWNAFY